MRGCPTPWKLILGRGLRAFWCSRKISLLACCFGLAAVLAGLGIGEARKAQPVGIIAGSVGEQVFLIDAGGGVVNEIESGVVGFLFPAPGRFLFAPNLIDERTSVIDLRRRQLQESLPYLNMPRFTVWKDRYIVLAGDLLMLSYPERSLIFRMKAQVESPWQLYSSEDGMSLLVLERNPKGKGPSVLTALDLSVRKQVFRKSYQEDFIRIAVLEDLGILVVADRSRKQLLILQADTLAMLKGIPLQDEPTDILGFGNTLLESGEPDGIRHWEIDRRRDGSLKLREKKVVGPGGKVMRMAMSPDRNFFAAAGENGGLAIFEFRKCRLIREMEVPGKVRDLVWTDPMSEGPSLPMWSDRGQGMPEDLRPKSLKK